MSRYQLVSHWHLDAPIATVWTALYDVARWPQWWSYVLDVEQVERGDATGVGAAHRITMGNALPYQLGFTMRFAVVQAPRLLQVITEGELNGEASWTLEEQGGATAVRYDWDVSPARTWMNVMAPVLGPMFRWNFGQVMADGAGGLARHLAARRR
jgi:uncharacterized protein YndB with AHSA1/START domain